MHDWFFRQSGRKRVIDWLGIDSWIDSSLAETRQTMQERWNAFSSFFARFRLAGQDFFASDSFITHDFGFTPSLSTWVETDSEAQLDQLFAALSADGQVLMPLGNYGFSARFGWLNDRFGVSWQLNLS